MDRVKHKWKVEIQSESGGVEHVDFHSHWNPEGTNIESEVGNAAAAMQSVKMQRKYLPIKARLVERAGKAVRQKSANKSS